MEKAAPPIVEKLCVCTSIRALLTVRSWDGSPTMSIFDNPRATSEPFRRCFKLQCQLRLSSTDTKANLWGQYLAFAKLLILIYNGSGDESFNNLPILFRFEFRIGKRHSREGSNGTNRLILYGRRQRRYCTVVQSSETETKKAYALVLQPDDLRARQRWLYSLAKSAMSEK